MKRFLLSLVLFGALPMITFCQFFWATINFDDGQNMNFLKIDNSLPSNIWQIGSPQKPFFNEAYSVPNVIVTDTVYPYPENNLSVFYLYLPLSPSALEQFMYFNFKICSDTLSDFGNIDFSFDKGITWHNLISEATSYGIYWRILLADPPWTTIYDCFDSVNPFTGKNSVWYTFDMSRLDPPPYYVDTVYYKFSFHSDGVQTNKDGWMIDEINLGNFYEGIEENNSKWIVSTEPNPFCFDFLLNITSDDIQNPKEQFIYKIFSAQGRKLAEQKFSGKTTKIEQLSNSPPGVYFLKIISDTKNICVKKIVKIE